MPSRRGDVHTSDGLQAKAKAQGREEMRIRNLTTLGLVVAIAACSESTTAPAPDTGLLNIDVAMVAADGVLDDVTSAAAMMDAPGSDRPGRGERNVALTFLDADGNEQDAMDPLTTATIIRSATMSRQGSRGGWTASVEATRDQTITGLEGEETTRTVNGTGTEHMLRSLHSDENGTRSYEMNSAVTWNDVVHGVPRSENPYPLSGSITRSISVVIINGRNGDETRSRTAVVTFNGTQFATLTLDGETMEIDLSTRGGRSPFRRRDR
jgi:hypothetical protein